MPLAVNLVIIEVRNGNNWSKVNSEGRPSQIGTMAALGDRPVHDREIKGDQRRNIVQHQAQARGIHHGFTIAVLDIYRRPKPSPLFDATPGDNEKACTEGDSGQNGTASVLLCF